MPTTARGIWTPSDTDAVDFTTDLATMAGTIDNALDLYGNALRGTASQRAAFLSTAVDGMLWQDTDGIRMIWRKDGALWVPAVWRWRGTTAQMNSFGANAPDGFGWFSTTSNSEYVRSSGAWVPVRAGVRLERATNFTLGGAGTPAAIPWSSVVQGDSSMFSLATPSRIQILHSGTYLFTSNIALLSSGAGIIIRYRINGAASDTSLGESTGVAAQPAWTAAANAAQLLTLTAGQYVEVHVVSSASGAVVRSAWTFFQCAKVSF